MNTPNVNDLLDTAVADGELSTQSQTALKPVMRDIQSTVRDNSERAPATEKTLVAVLLDNTPSTDVLVGTKRAYESFVEGVNLVLDALMKARLADSVEVLIDFINPDTVYLNSISQGQSAAQWCPLAVSPRLQSFGFIHGESTPLFDSTLQMLGSIVAQTKLLEQDGTSVRTITLILSDGDDNVSQMSAADVKNVITDMLRTERHRVFFMGVNTSAGVDFQEIARRMGIPASCIDVVPNDPQKIRSKFSLFSQQASKVASNTADPNTLTFKS